MLRRTFIKLVAAAVARALIPWKRAKAPAPEPEIQELIWERVYDPTRDNPGLKPEETNWDGPFDPIGDLASMAEKLKAETGITTWHVDWGQTKPEPYPYREIIFKGEGPLDLTPHKGR